MTWRAMSYHVVTYHLTWRAMSYHVVTYHVVTYHVLPCSWLLTWRAMSYHVVTYHGNAFSFEGPMSLPFPPPCPRHFKFAKTPNRSALQKVCSSVWGGRPIALTAGFDLTGVVFGFSGGSVSSLSVVTLPPQPHAAT